MKAVFRNANLLTIQTNLGRLKVDLGAGAAYHVPHKKAALPCNLPSNKRDPLTPSAGLFSTCGFRLQTVATSVVATACLTKSTSGYRAKNC